MGWLSTFHIGLKVEVKALSTRLTQVTGPLRLHRSTFLRMPGPQQTLNEMLPGA